MMELSSLIDFEVNVIYEYKKVSVSWCPISYCASVILRCLFGGSVTSCPV